jgi:hypothetical protein
VNTVTLAAAAPAWPAGTAGTAVIVIGLLLAAVTGVLALLSKPLPRWVYVLVALLEIAVLWMTVVCAAAWIGGTAPVDPIVFLAYLAVVLVAGPATAWWGAGEPGRWGSGVVAMAGLVVPVLVLRLQQVWSGATTGGTTGG